MMLKQHFSAQSAHRQAALARDAVPRACFSSSSSRPCTPAAGAVLRRTDGQRAVRRGAPLAALKPACELHGAVVAKPDMKFGVIVGRFNDLVTKLLLNGALHAFEMHGVSGDNINVCWVPGAFELPVVAKSMAKSGQYDAVVCIGTVVRGSTTHYDEVCSAATSGILNAGVDTGVPVIFGVLTCDTMEQALDRAGGKTGNKGGEAAITAIEMANLLRTLRSGNMAVGPWNVAGKQ